MTGSVFAAYLHDGDQVSHSFMRSVMNTPRELLWGGTFAGRLTRTGDIPGGRNDMTAHFLDGTDAEWMWFVDSDMGWQPDALSRLLDAADADKRPVVGAYCVALKHGEPDGAGGYHVKQQPTLYTWNDRGFIAFDPRLEPGPLVRVDGTGAACLLIHRSTFEAVRRDQLGDTWWQPVIMDDRRLMGEDLSFCFRLRRLAIPVHVHTHVRTTHAKRVWLS